jgi:hypothetical protein
VGSSIEGSCLPHCRFVAAVPHSAADALLLRHEAVLLAAIVPIVIPFDHGARGGSCAALGGALTRAALGSHLPNAEHIADALLNVPEVPTEDRCSALATLASTAAATALLRRRAGGVSAAAAASLARHATTTSELRRKTTIKMTFGLQLSLILRVPDLVDLPPKYWYGATLILSRRRLISPKSHIPVNEEHCVSEGLCPSVSAAGRGRHYLLEQTRLEKKI